MLSTTTTTAVLSAAREETIIVDVQWLHGTGKQLFAKELAFFCPHTLNSIVYHFQPPYDESEIIGSEALKQNRHCKRWVNGLKWSEGDIPYTELRSIIQKHVAGGCVLVAQTTQKLNFLEKFLSNDFGGITRVVAEMPSIKKHFHAYNIICPVHSDIITGDGDIDDGKIFSCAYRNAFVIFLHLEKTNFFCRVCTVN